VITTDRWWFKLVIGLNILKNKKSLEEKKSYVSMSGTDVPSKCCHSYRGSGIFVRHYNLQRVYSADRSKSQKGERTKYTNEERSVHDLSVDPSSCKIQFAQKYKHTFMVFYKHYIIFAHFISVVIRHSTFYTISIFYGSNDRFLF